MHYVQDDRIKDSSRKDFIDDMKIREDLEQLTVEDFIDALLDTIDNNTTVEMIEDNLMGAASLIQEYKRERILKILLLKHSWYFIESEKQQKRRKKQKPAFSLIQLPSKAVKKVEQFIDDDCVKRVFDYSSVDEFVVSAIEQTLNAEKGVVLMEE